jgi:hypothetical protein
MELPVQEPGTASMGTANPVSKVWQPENLFMNLGLSHLRRFLLITLWYSG